MHNLCTGGVPQGGLRESGPRSHPQPRSPAAPPGTPPWPGANPSPVPPSCLQGNLLGPGPLPSSISTWEPGSSPAPHRRHWSPSAGRSVRVKPLPPLLLVAICRAIGRAVGPRSHPPWPGTAHSPAPPSCPGPALVEAHRGRQHLRHVPR